jgi:hypothetical protein
MAFVENKKGSRLGKTDLELTTGTQQPFQLLRKRL